LKNKFEPILARGKELSKKLNGVKDAVYDPDIQHDVGEDDIHGLERLQDELSGLAFRASGSYGQAPSPLVREKVKELSAEVAEQLKAFNDLLGSEVPEYNKAAEAAGAPTVFVGTAIEVKPSKGT
jgi:hypothetical protein